MDFTEFKDKYFNGDESMAMQQLAKEDYYECYTLTKDVASLKKIVSSIDISDFSKFINFISQEKKRHPEVSKKHCLRDTLLMKTKMESKEEVMSADPDHFSKKLRRWLFIALPIIFVLAGLSAFTFIGELDDFKAPVTTVSSLIILVLGIILLVQRKRKVAFKQLREFYIKEDESGFRPFIPDDSNVEHEKLTRNTKIKLSRALCFSNFSLVYGDIKNALLTCTLALFTITLIIFCSGEIIAGLVFTALSTIPLFFLIKTINRISNYNNLNFHIEKLRCVAKKVNRDADDDIVSKKIVFEDGKFYNTSHHATQRISQEHGTLFFESIKEGSLWYVVTVDNHIAFILPCDNYEIPMHEFVCNGNLFTPIKDKKGKTLFEEECKLQTAGFDAPTRQIVTNTEKEIDKLKRTFSIQVAALLVSSVFCAIGFIYPSLAMLILILNSILIVLPAVFSIVASIKANKAFDKVPPHFVGYETLKYKNSLGALSILMLILGILVCTISVFPLVM